MLETLLFILIVALVLFVIYWACSLLIKGVALQIIGAILAVILVITALKKLGVSIGGL